MKKRAGIVLLGVVSMALLLRVWAMDSQPRVMAEAVGVSQVEAGVTVSKAFATGGEGDWRVFEIKQKDRRFFYDNDYIESIRVEVGDKVRFLNVDEEIHNLYSVSPVKKFNLGIDRTGNVHVLTFNKPGRVTVDCSIHENMRIVVDVVDQPEQNNAG